MADNTQQHDNELADLTDALMAGQDMTTSDDLQDLAQLTRQLHTLIASDSTPSTAYRNRLTERLNAEWAQTHAQPPRRVSPRGSTFQIGQTGRWAALAAVLVLILLAVVSSLSNNGVVTSVPGTVVGTLTPQFAIFFALAVIVVTVVAFIVLRRRR